MRGLYSRSAFSGPRGARRRARYDSEVNEFRPTASERRAGAYTLAVLTFINLFNYLDRWVVGALVEPIKHSLHLSDTRIGLINSGFIVVYILASPLFGVLGDRRSRPPLIAVGVFVWSIATTLAGFARGFGTLFAARSTVGVGEAAYGSIAPALLADTFPFRSRGRVFAVFFAAIPVGSAAGYVVGGLVNQHFGWRAAFWIAGAPGLLLSLLVLLIKDPPRGQHEEVKISVRPAGNAYLRLLRNRPYILTVLGYAANTFALGGLALWMPAFLERIRGMSGHEATVTFGAITVLTGLGGTYIGGWLGDFFLRRSRHSYLWVSGISTLLAAPATYICLTDPRRSVYLPAIVIAEMLIFMSTGPVNSAIVNAVAPQERATAVGLSVLMVHLFGDIPSQPIIGALSEASNLGRALLIVPVAIVTSGVLWMFTAWRGE